MKDSILHVVIFMGMTAITSFTRKRLGSWVLFPWVSGSDQNFLCQPGARPLGRSLENSSKYLGKMDLPWQNSFNFFWPKVWFCSICGLIKMKLSLVISHRVPLNPQETFEISFFSREKSMLNTALISCPIVKAVLQCPVQLANYHPIYLKSLFGQISWKEIFSKIKYLNFCWYNFEGLSFEP